MELAKERYQKKLTTLSGYILESVEELGISTINLAWLAEQMGITKVNLQSCLLEMRKNGLLTDVPTVDPRTGKPLSDRAANKKDYRSQPKKGLIEK